MARHSTAGLVSCLAGCLLSLTHRYPFFPSFVVSSPAGQYLGTVVGMFQLRPPVPIHPHTWHGRSVFVCL